MKDFFYWKMFINPETGKENKITSVFCLKPNDHRTTVSELFNLYSPFFLSAGAFENLAKCFFYER